jgi:carbon-monoxide dehydrogenase medium subunit
MRTFDFHAPTALKEALELLNRCDRSRPLAGGTDLVVQMKEAATKFTYPPSVISLLRVPELQGIEFDQSSGLRIGATTTMADLADSAEVQEHYAAIAEGAAVVGSVQTMNMATLGGNLCNAAPSADTAPPLLAHDAEVVLTGPAGQRSLPTYEFLVGPGETALAPTELLVEVRVPTPADRSGAAYVRHTPRHQMDIAVVGVAVFITLADGDRVENVRIALGAVAPTPIRATNAEATLKGQLATEDSFANAAKTAAAECNPISDIRGSVEFRRHLAETMTKRMLQRAANRAKGG